ncbi:hypothetical protein BIT28_07395 [Photobacterium proteolyticum]|uniref:Uncharacterized protein n=1 Tax=Photobacterium proteolyticum TaxID=1903952 RepID=A0A1Q9GS35_9GAMM|nr:hypothetical protein [Photobacterium proteolyticum]OLQ77457.1 hypothetical protein BIT28_07395 [Photobacterium proteolyticum]
MKNSVFLERFVRVLLLISIIIIVFLLLPFFQGAKDLVILYPTIKEYGFTWLIGKEWFLLGIISGLLSVIFWHTFFFSVIRGRNWGLGKINRKLLIKSYDYFWYIGSFITILVTLDTLYYTHLKNIEENITHDVANYEVLLIRSEGELKKRCGMVNETIMDSRLDKKVLAVCSFNGKSKAKRLEVCKTAEMGDGYSELTGNRTDKYKELSDMASVQCNSLRNLETTSKYLGAIRETMNIKEDSMFNKLFWTFFFPIIIGFRVVKTSIELVDERRKIASEKIRKEDFNSYLLKYIYPSTYMSK